MLKHLLPLALLLAATPALAQEVFDAEETARVRVNPFSDRISVPFKNDWDFGGGEGENGSAYKVEIEPVIPFSLSQNWSLISRTILPIQAQSNVSGEGESQAGLGDTTQSFFVSPKARLGGWLSVGAGPAFIVPTSTNSTIANDRFSLGPTMALNARAGAFTIGFLAYQVWSVGDNSSQKAVNKAYFQPAVTWISRSGLNFGVNTETECDWLEEGTQCSVPVNFTVGHPFRINKGLDIHISGGGRYYAVRTENNPFWGLRFEVTMIFDSKR
jgi:hypothetical protein